MERDFDLVIRGGTIADGTGGELFEADIGIEGGKIGEVGRVKAAGREEIDARGRLVTPGFVDIHTHYDGQAIWSDRLAPSSWHGVSTVVMGNCGVGFAPCRPEHRELLISVMEGVEDIPEVVMARGLTWEWESFPQYLQCLGARAFDIDIATQIPHSALRVFVMGERGAAREPATDDDRKRMAALVREGMQMGALGFSSSRLFIHRTRDGQPIPSFEAAEEELGAIAKALGDTGRGVLQFVLNIPVRAVEDEIALLTRLARISGRPVSFSLAQDNSNPESWRRAMDGVSAANEAGLSLRAQVFPRAIGLMIGFDLSVNPFSLCPSWPALASLPFEARIAELRKDDVRARLLAELPGDPRAPLAALGRNFERMFALADPPDYEPTIAMSVAAQARRAGKSPEAFAYDYLLDDGGRGLLYVALTNYADGSLDAALAMMRHKHTVLGLGDGGAHYGMIADSGYPTFLLQHWTRDRTRGEKLSIPEAVKALCRDPAEAVGLSDRGRIAPGLKADLNVIDHGALKLHKPVAVYDLPSGGRRVMQAAEGYDANIVSGVVTYRHGAATGALPGRLVRGAHRSGRLS